MPMENIFMKRSKELLLLLLTLVFYGNFLSRVSLSPLLPIIRDEFAISTGQASQLFLFLSVGYFVAQMASGFLAARFGHKRSILISIFFSSLFLLGMAMSNFIGLYSWFVFGLGLATGIYLPSGISTITTMFPSKNWGRAVSVHEFAPNLAFLTAPIFVTFFTKHYNWHYFLITLSLFTFCLGILVAVSGLENRLGQAPSLSSCKKFLATREYWLMITVFGLGITGTLGVYNMLPVFLVQWHAYTDADANYILSLSRISTLFTAFLGGMLVDKFGSRKMVRLVLLVSGLLTLSLGMLQGFFLKIAVFLQPVFAVCFFPAAFAAISEMTTQRERNLLVSMIVPSAFVIGSGIMPRFMGWFADMGRFDMGFGATGLLILIGVVAARALERL